MQQVARWITFCMSSAVTRTVLHFYPSAANVTAPYPANCRLTLYGFGSEAKTITIDGLRISQPDGIRIEDAFPGIAEAEVNLFGLEVEIYTTQPRVDLSGSTCVTEIRVGGQITRFSAVPLKEEEDAAKKAAAITRYHSEVLLKDGFTSTSFLVVNAGAVPAKLELLTPEGQGVRAVLTEELPAGSAREIDVEKTYSASAGTQPASWGAVQAQPVILGGTLSPEVVCFSLQRESSTRCPVSVSAL